MGEKRYEIKDHLGNVRAVTSDIKNASNYSGVVSSWRFLADLKSMSNYHPYGSLIDEGSWSASNYQFAFNGKQEEVFDKDFLDFGARSYDNVRSIFIKTDAFEKNYPSFSPFIFVRNNPINAIDLDGNDSYLVVWFSKEGETGHAGIAIENYTTILKKDLKGNPIFMSDGSFEKEIVKDGTLSYYDIWPYDPVSKGDLQSNVKPDYSEGVEIISIDKLLNEDPTKFREGNVSPEGKPPEGVIKLGTNMEQDNEMKEYAKKTSGFKIPYNACNFNCSTFAESVLKISYNDLNSSQFLEIPSTINILYPSFKDVNIVAPNNLYNSVLGLPNSTLLKGPENVQAKPYLEYYGK